MEKAQATKLLGGTPSAAADAIGISPQAYGQWPQDLPPRLVDRVVAALARKIFPPGEIEGIPAFGKKQIRAGGLADVATSTSEVA